MKHSWQFIKENLFKLQKIVLFKWEKNYSRKSDARPEYVIKPHCQTNFDCHKRLLLRTSLDVGEAHFK